MISISKDLYINKLDDIVDKYNNAYHRTIKMKPLNFKSSTSTYIDFGVENNDNYLNIKFGDPQKQPPEVFCKKRSS